MTTDYYGSGVGGKRRDASPVDGRLLVWIVVVMIDGVKVSKISILRERFSRVSSASAASFGQCCRTIGWILDLRESGSFSTRRFGVKKGKITFCSW